MTITHDALDFTVQPPSHQIMDLFTSGVGSCRKLSQTSSNTKERKESLHQIIFKCRKFCFPKVSKTLPSNVRSSPTERMGLEELVEETLSHRIPPNRSHLILSAI